MHLIGNEYREIESRSVGGTIPANTQICKLILTALCRDRNAIQYFPWHHLCNVKRLRQGVDTYKKDPFRYFLATPPTTAQNFFDDEEAREVRGNDGGEEWQDDGEEQWQDDGDVF